MSSLTYNISHKNVTKFIKPWVANGTLVIFIKSKIKKKGTVTMLHYIPQSTQFLYRSRLFSKHCAVNNFRALNYVVLVFIPLVNLV